MRRAIVARLVWLRHSLAGWVAIETMRSCAEKPQTSNGDNGQIPRDVVEYVPLLWGKRHPSPVPAWCAYPSRAVWIDNLPPLRLEPGDNYRRPLVVLADERKVPLSAAASCLSIAWPGRESQFGMTSDKRRQADRMTWPIQLPSTSSPPLFLLPLPSN